MRRLVIFLLLNLLPLCGVSAEDTTSIEETTTIVVLGDSLVAGYGVSPEYSFPAQLANYLQKEFESVEVINAGISGDTTAGGRARLSQVINLYPDIVIVVLGANDLLRGFTPEETRANLDYIVSELRKKNIHVLLGGFVAPPNYGEEFVVAFNGIYKEIAKEHHAILYPFFLEEVYGKKDLNLPDGLHPNAEGIRKVVEGITPYVIESMDLFQY